MMKTLIEALGEKSNKPMKEQEYLNVLMKFGVAGGMVRTPVVTNWVPASGRKALLY